MWFWTVLKHSPRHQWLWYRERRGYYCRSAELNLPVLAFSHCVLAARLNSFPVGNLLMQNEQLIHTNNRHAFCSPLVKFWAKCVHLRAVAVDRSGTVTFYWGVGLWVQSITRHKLAVTVPHLRTGDCLIIGAGRLWNSSSAGGQKPNFQVSARRVGPLLFHSDFSQE